MLDKPRRKLCGKLRFIRHFTAIMCLAMSGCSGDEKPPHVGVFLKNPGEQFTKIEQGMPTDDSWAPLAKEGAKVYFYGVAIDFTKLLIGMPVYTEHHDIDYEWLPIPVKKLGEDLYCFELNQDWLGDGVTSFGCNDTEERWYLRGEGPRLLSRKGENGSIEEQCSFVMWKDSTFKAAADQIQFGMRGKCTRWFPTGQMQCSGNYELPQKSVGEAVADLHFESPMATNSDVNTMPRIRNLIYEYYVARAWSIVPGTIMKSKTAEYLSLDSRRKELGLTPDQVKKFCQEVRRIRTTSVQHGLWTYWHENGQKQMEGEYVFGEKNGIWQTWDVHGNLTATEMFDNGRLVEVKGQ